MKRQTLKKLCAVITSVCFVMMIFSPNVLANISSSQKGFYSLSEREDNNVQESLISDKYGKIISLNNTGSDTVVINVQYLHCDYSVQKNIYYILDELCEKYDIKNIYEEGGVGATDFGIFAHLNPAYRKTILEKLLNAGTLTGAEYYTILNDKKDFLKGIEDEKSYNQNIVRLSEILKSKQDTQKYLSNIDKEIDFLKAKYLSVNNKKLNELLDKYEHKKISQEKFLAHLIAFANANNINTKKYKNLHSYINVMVSSSEINKKNLAREFTNIIAKIKGSVSYEEYKKILAITSDFTEIRTSKLVIENYCKNKEINIANVYPNLNKFFSLKKESFHFNSIAMVKEERKLIDTIRTYFSDSLTELEIAYIADFKDFYKKYITAELTSAQWEYVKVGIEKFEELYAKYSVQDDVAKLKKYSSILTDFYNINTERNYTFLKNMNILSSVDSVNTKFSDISNILSKAKNIVILVSGGYHTDGITEILDENNISNITITPEVANYTPSTRIMYENLVIQQAMSVRSMIGLKLILNAEMKEQISAVVSSMFPNQSLDDVNINMLATHLNQIFDKDVSVSVLPDSKSLEFVFSDGATQVIDVTEDVAHIVSAQDMKNLSQGQFQQVTDKELENLVELVNKTTFNFGRDIFAPQIYKISKDICLFMVENKWYLGNGAIYDIAASNYEGKSLDGIEPIIYEYMPGFMQEGLLAAEKKQKSKTKAPKTTRKIVANIVKKVIALVFALTVVLNMTACRMKDKNDGINYITEQQLTDTNIDFNGTVYDNLQSFANGKGRYKSFLYENMPVQYQNEVKFSDLYILQNLENLYDQALAAISYMQIGRFPEAEAILGNINSNGDLYKSNLYEESKVVTGEAVWVGIAAMQYKLTSEEDNGRFDSLIEKVDNYLKTVAKEDGSYYGEHAESYVSTEHVLDAIAYWNLKLIDNPEDLYAKDRLEKGLNFLYTKVYNGQQHYFYRGVEDGEKVLDVQAWAIQVLLAVKRYNPEIYEKTAAKDIDTDDIFKYVEDNFKKSVTYNKKTYDDLYVCDSKTGSNIVFEWIMELAVSYKLAGKTDKCKKIMADVVAYSEALGFTDGYIPYSDVNGELNYKSYGWAVYAIPALCTTIGQTVQEHYNSFFFPIAKISGVSYTPSDRSNYKPVIVAENVGDTWKSYSILLPGDKPFDLSKAEYVKIKMSLIDPVDNAAVKLQYLPVNPWGRQNFEGKNYGSYWRNNFYFDNNGELTINLTMDEYKSCFAEPELTPNLIDLEHMKIILNVGRLYFGEELNSQDLNVDVEEIEIKYIDGEYAGETIVYSPYASDKSILPSTFKKINDLIMQGSASTLNILKAILKAETLYSFFSPNKFVKEHTSDTTGAKNLSKITNIAKFAGLATTISFAVFFAMANFSFLISLLTLAGIFVTSMIIALVVNIFAHAIIDFKFIKASGVQEAIKTYGKDRVSFREDGTIIVLNEIEKNAEDFNFVPVPIKIKGQRVWLGKYRGNTVLFSSGAVQEDLVSDFVDSYSFRSLYGAKFNDKIMIIDTSNPDRDLSYSDEGYIIIGVNALKTGDRIDFEKEGALIANKKIDAITINQNIAVFIDDSADTISSYEDMVSTINTFIKSDTLGTSAKILFTNSYIDKIINLLQQKYGNDYDAKIKFREIIKQLKDENKDISVVFEQVDTGTDLQKYFEYGIFTYVANGIYFDSVSTIQTRVKMISDLSKIESFDGSLSVLRISQFRDELDKTSGIFTFLNSAINIKKIMADRKIAFVKQAATNFDFKQIPEIPQDVIVDIIKTGEYTKFERLSSYLEPSSQISIYYNTLKDSEKAVFSEEILKRILVVNYLRQQDIKYGLSDHNLEVLLAEVLYKSVVSQYYENLAVDTQYDNSIKGTIIAVDAFKQSVNSMTPAEVYKSLNELLTKLSPLALERSAPDAIAAIVELIPVYADKNLSQVDSSNIEFINEKTLTGLRSVLAAA